MVLALVIKALLAPTRDNTLLAQVVLGPGGQAYGVDSGPERRGSLQQQQRHVIILMHVVVVRVEHNLLHSDVLVRRNFCLRLQVPLPETNPQLVGSEAVACVRALRIRNTINRIEIREKHYEIFYKFAFLIISCFNHCLTHET